MSVPGLDVVHGIKLPTVFISQIPSGGARVVSGIELSTGTPSGNPFATWTCIRGQSPTFGLTTTQILSLLTVAGTVGANLAGNTDFYSRKVTEQGRRSSGSVHNRWRAAMAMLALGTLTVSGGGPATISSTIHVNYDGTNEPIVHAGSQALPDAVSYDEDFATGPCTINSVQFAGVIELSINFGVQVFVRPADGEIYPTFIAIQSAQPIVTFKTLGNPWAIGLNGAEIESAGFGLRRKINAGGNYAVDAGEHILFEATAGHVQVEELSGGGNDECVHQVTCTPVSADGDADALTVDLAADL